MQYEAFRRIDPVASSTPAAGQLSAKTPGYEFVAAIPAHVEPEYNMVVPTLVDGVPAGFFVRAATPSPEVYFDNCEVEVTTVDDLAPPAPSSFVVAYGSAGNTLSWAPASAPDLVGYHVHRGLHPDFVSTEEHRIATTAELTLQDSVSTPFAQFYKLTAVDDAGNESPVVTPGVVTGTDGPAPIRFALLAPKPNPFNPRTTAVFDVPAHAGVVRLAVHDLAGRRIRSRHDGTLPSGRHEVTWDGLDAEGRGGGSEPYILRLQADGFEATRKVTLLK